MHTSQDAVVFGFRSIESRHAHATVLPVWIGSVPLIQAVDLQGVQSFPKFPSAPLSREQSRISAAPSVTELASQSVASMGSLLGQQSVSGPSRPGSAVANNRGGQVSSAVAVGQAADRFTTRFMKDIVDARRNLDAFEKHWPEILAKLATNSLT